MSRRYQLDGIGIPFVKGQTIMESALAAGVYIPHLCHRTGFAPHGSCRVCLVRHNGRFVSACTQLAEENAQVESETETIRTMRREIVAMLFVEGVHVCPSCEKSGDCELQAVAYHVDLLSPEFTYAHPQQRIDASHADIMIDFNRCILCELCVRAGRDVDGKHFFSIAGRGSNTRLVVNSISGKLVDSDIKISDMAAQICPVGAILPKHRGFETPIGERRYDQRTIAEIAENFSHDGEKHD